MKQTGKIELLNGSFIPNARGLWYSTQEKLHEAQMGVEQMREAKDRVSYESGWVRFIESLEESWTSFFDEGKNRFSNFEPWAGSKNKQRKSDPLISYLIQSRHQSQHGNICIEWEEGRIQIAPNYFGHIRDLKIYPDGAFEVEASPLGNAHSSVTLKHETGKALLPVIENKMHKQKFDIPKEHLGKVISNCDPLLLAKMAIDYYKSIYQEALEKFNAKKA